jgi:uncharacterized Zn finger protein
MSNWINPPLHIICGRCGNKNDLTFKIIIDDEEPYVSISCENCGTVTGLDEVLKEEKK